MSLSKKANPIFSLVLSKVTKLNIVIMCIFLFLFAGGSIAYALLAEEEYLVACKLQPSEFVNEVLVATGITSGLSGVFGDMESPVMKKIEISFNSISFKKRIYDAFKKNNKLFNEILNKIEEENIDAELKESKKIYHALERINEVINLNKHDDETFSVSVRLHDRYFALELLDFTLEVLKKHVRENNIMILKNDIAYYNRMLEFCQDPITKQEVTKILAAKINKTYTLSSNVFTVLDEARLPFYRIWPKRSIIVLFSTFLGGVLGFLTILVKESIKRES